MNTPDHVATSALPRAFLLVTALTMLAGCLEMGPASFLGARDKEITEATQAIETATDDAQRAKAYSSRGAAYSEKARYSRMFKLVASQEYERLFGLALSDHNQAIALNPASAEVYFNRAQMYYDRGSLDLVEQREGSKTWFDPAAADFEKAVQIDPKYSLALDRLGLTYESNGEWDKAVHAYTQEMALDSLGAHRLADAYCNIGHQRQLGKDFAGAAAAYEKSIGFGIADDDSCPVNPFESAVAIYTTQTRQYEKAWDVVHQAQKLRRRIASGILDRLQNDSGRAN